MNFLLKSGFLDSIFCQQDSIQIDYDFKNPSYESFTNTIGRTGYLIYNQQVETGYQYSGGQIINSGNPILSISDTGRAPFSIISGHFNGSSKYKVLGSFPTGDWTAFVVFKHLETGDFVNSKVIFSSKETINSASGYVMGINGCNRIFFEHPTQSSGNRIYTLNEELDNKNVISVAKIDDSLSLGFHQFEDNLNKISVNTKFQMLDYLNSDSMYIGGIGASGKSYKNFSGYIDEFILFNIGLEFPERNSFAKAFFCSGFSTGEIVAVPTYANAVTGLEMVEKIIATGVTGYQKILIGTQSTDGGNVDIYAYSGVTGYIYDTITIELTGSVLTDTYEYEQRPSSGIVDYGYLFGFANSKVVLLNNFDSSFKEVYSFSGKNTDDINLIPVFSEQNLTYTVFQTGSGEIINFYLNGLLMPNVSGFVDSMTGEFVHTGNLLDSNGFYDIIDFPVYDIISGNFALTGITTTDVNNGSKTLTQTYVNGRDFYLNGMKLVSGIDYSGVGANIVISTTNLIDGDLCLAPKHLCNLNRFTGVGDNNFDTSIPLFEEQIWVNGLRQIKNLDYIKTSDFSLKYSSFSLDQFPDIVYNNSTGFLNV